MFEVTASALAYSENCNSDHTCGSPNLTRPMYDRIVGGGLHFNHQDRVLSESTLRCDLLSTRGEGHPSVLTVNDQVGIKHH